MRNNRKLSLSSLLTSEFFQTFLQLSVRLKFFGHIYALDLHTHWALPEVQADGGELSEVGAALHDVNTIHLTVTYNYI